MNDPTDIVEQELVRAEQAKRERQERAAEASVLQRVLSTEFGRTFVMSQLERAGVFRLSLDMGATESTHLTAFQEGRRSEGLHTYTQIIEHCPELWLVMIRERARRIEAQKGAA